MLMPRSHRIGTRSHRTRWGATVRVESPAGRDYLPAFLRPVNGGRQSRSSCRTCATAQARRLRGTFSLAVSADRASIPHFDTRKRGCSNTLECPSTCLLPPFRLLYGLVMAPTTARGPKPWSQHRVSTIFLRVPSADWTAVRHGRKREFRAESGKVSQLWNVECPVPVVAYKVDSGGRYDSVLMVLESVWREPLGAISPESLEAEGFESFAHFRRHWCIRERRRFRPLHMTTVFRLRPWLPDDGPAMADALLRRLYGDFLNADAGTKQLTQPASVAALPESGPLGR